MVKLCSRRTLYFMFLNRPPTDGPANQYILPSTPRPIQTHQGQPNESHALVCTCRRGPPSHWRPYARTNALQKSYLNQPRWQSGGRRYLRSPSKLRAKTHCSPGSRPYFDPSGSVSITCWMALPTRPDPPVTSTTFGIVRSWLLEKSGR